MAVYTHVDADQVKAFLEQYDLGNYQSHDGILSGVENTNYDLRTDTTRTILTVFEKRINPADLPFVFAFVDHLKKNNLPVPDVYKNNDGGKMSLLAEKPAAISRFLNGNSVIPAEITPDHCAQVGEILGRMHVASKSFELTRKKPVGPNTCRSLLEEIQTDETALPDALRERLEEILNGWEQLLLTDLPTGAIHADLFPDNVFFNEDKKISGIIDFYFSCTNVYAYDLAITMNAWCFDGEHQLDRTKWDALLSAYQSVRTLNEDEKKAFPKLRQAAALRFFMTRQYDWINTPVDADVVKHDPKEYAIKLEAECPAM